MERLTYKFNSLSLANFAANTIKKDGVGTILSNNNGFVVVETADVNSVQEIANDARGYEVLRESMTEKKKLTPDQLKKVNTSLRAKMIAKKDAKKEEVEEEEFVGEKLIGKQHKLDFNKDGKLTGKDFEILKTIRKQKAKKEEVEEEMTEAFRFRQQDWEKMRAKYKQGTPVNITLKSGKTVSGTLLRMDKYDRGTTDQGHMLHVKTTGGNTKVEDVDVKSIYWNNDPKTKMSEEIEAIDEAMNNYIAFYNGKKMTVQAETSYKAQLKAIEMFKAPASKKHMVTVKLADNKAAFAANEEVEQVDEATKTIQLGKRVFIPASPAAERRHKEEDSKKPGEIWTTKPDSFGQTRVGAKNLDGFVRYFRSGMEPTAKKWAKKRETWKQVPFFKDDPYKEEVEQVDEAAPAIKAGMRLYAKQDKKTDNGSVVKGQYYKVADAGNGLFDLIHQSTGYRKAMHKVTASAIQAMIQNKIF